MSNRYTINGQKPTPESFQAAADWAHRALEPAQQRQDPLEDDLITDETVSFVERHRETSPWDHSHGGTFESHQEFNRQGTGGRIAREGLGAMNRHGFVMSATRLDHPDAGNRADRVAAAGFADRAAYRGSRDRMVGIRPSVPLDASRGDRVREDANGSRYELERGSAPGWMAARSVRPLRSSDDRADWADSYRDANGIGGLNG